MTVRLVGFYKHDGHNGVEYLEFVNSIGMHSSLGFDVYWSNE